MIQDLLQRKHEMEAKMDSDPSDDGLRSSYFDVLNSIARSHFGVFFAIFPEIATPLLFRGGSSDVWNMHQVFMNRQYDCEIEEPDTILDLGAYVGYTAVYFINRFPHARLISVEPPSSNFDVLAANTAAYPNIRCLPAAVWHERTQLILEDSSSSYGDWGTYFRPTESAPPGEAVAAYTIGDILEMNGWAGVDLIKCSSHAGRVDVLLKPRPDWLASTSTIITRPGAQGWQAGDDEELLAALPSTEFERRSHGPLAVFRRRATGGDDTTGQLPRTLHLVPVAPERRQFTLSNVEDRLNFFSFGDRNLQLAPNPPGSAPASVAIRLDLAGQSRFLAGIATSPSPSGATRFTVRIRNVETGESLASSQESLSPNAATDMQVNFGQARGLHDVILSTEAVDSEVQATFSRRPAYFIEPRLT